MSQDKRFAVLIDADNVAPRFIQTIFREMSNEGTITYKRIYGDWTRPDLGTWKKLLLEHSITPIQQYSYTTGKNSTDSAMIIDAMDILYAGKVEGFCIVSSDSDFTRLAARLRESGEYVIGMGEKKTPKPFIAACDKFRYLDLLTDTENASRSKKRRNDRKRSHDHDHEQEPVTEAAVPEDTTQTSINVIRDAIAAIITEISDDDDWAPLSHIGNILLKRYPDFDVRNYGYLKLIELMKSFNCFELKTVTNKDGNRIKYIRNLD